MDIKPYGVLTAVGIGIGAMIGSGWLFSAYYAARFIGPASIISWAIGAGIALVLALLLAEIAGLFSADALFIRLLTISHDNADLGFIIGISGWLGLCLVIPTEASATIQYLSSITPALGDMLLLDGKHTPFGSICVASLVIAYTLINFWGMRTFASVSNAIAVFKIVVPVLTALILIATSFHLSNFTVLKFAPYGYEPIFSGIVVCGIFYAFYGFSLVAMYGQSLKNPKKNIPRALVFSVFIVFLIYALLQLAFVGSLPQSLVQQGWSNLNFTSPFAQLLILLSMPILSMWAMVLYVDAAVSPSGTAVICLSSATRSMTGMADDSQMPAYFKKLHPKYLISRRSLLATTLLSCLVLIFFKNWQELMILVSIFQLLSCIAIPVAFTKLRSSKPHIERVYRLKGGNIWSYLAFMLLSYFLIKTDWYSLFVASAILVALFVIYVLNYYKNQWHEIFRAFYAAWSLFLYLFLVCLFAVSNHFKLLGNYDGLIAYLIVLSFNFRLLINQKYSRAGYFEK